MEDHETLLQRMLAANDAYVDGGHDTTAPVVPRLHLAIVTCMDARVMPPEALGLQAGDMHVLRNAGARVTDDVLRSLAVSCAVLDVRNVLVMPHSECGMQKPEALIRERIHELSGHDGPAELLEYGDPQAALRADVERIRSAPFLPPGMKVWGGRIDIHTGRVTIEVDA